MDHFKQLNDSLGHLAGDGVLTAVATLIQSCMRSTTDMAARFGGEEFVMVLPGADRAQAVAVAERLVAAVRAHAFSVPGSDRPVRCTMSCGVASSPAGHPFTANELIARADQALYVAKREGRDRVAYGGSTETV